MGVAAAGAPFSSILVPVDFSDFAAKAVKYGARFAEQKVLRAARAFEKAQPFPRPPALL